MVTKLVQHWSGFAEIDKLELWCSFADADRFDQARSMQKNNKYIYQVSGPWLVQQLKRKKQAAVITGLKKKNLWLSYILR